METESLYSYKPWRRPLIVLIAENPSTPAFSLSTPAAQAGKSSPPSGALSTSESFRRSEKPSPVAVLPRSPASANCSSATIPVLPRFFCINCKASLLYNGR